MKVWVNGCCSFAGLKSTCHGFITCHGLKSTCLGSKITCHGFITCHGLKITCHGFITCHGSKTTCHGLKSTCHTMDGKRWVPPAMHQHFLFCIMDEFVMAYVCTVLLLQGYNFKAQLWGTLAFDYSCISTPSAPLGLALTACSLFLSWSLCSGVTRSE